MSAETPDPSQNLGAAPTPTTRNEGDHAPLAADESELIAKGIHEPIPGLHPTPGLEVYPGVFHHDPKGPEIHGLTPRRAMWTFALVFVLLVGAQFAGAVAVNYVVDPRSEFGTELFVPLVLGDVRIKADALDGSEAPRTLILGSSRAMTLAPANLPAAHQPGFNYAISAGNPAEARAIYRMVVDQKGAPEIVLIGLDFDRVLGDQDVSVSVRNGPVGPYTDDPPNFVSRAQTLADTVQYEYLLDSARSVAYTFTAAPEGAYTFDDDGLRHFQPFEDPAKRPSYDVAGAINRTFVELEHRSEAISSAKAHGVGSLQELVDEAVTGGAQVHLFFTPLHPTLAQRAAGTTYPQAFQIVKNAALALCQPNVQVQDLSDITTFGGSAEDFYDGWHYVGETARKVLEIAVTSEGNLCTSTGVA